MLSCTKFCRRTNESFIKEKYRTEYNDSAGTINLNPNKCGAVSNTHFVVVGKIFPFFIESNY